MSASGPRPPLLLERLLERLLAGGSREEILGDLDEEFRARGGSFAARLWYARAAVSIAVRACGVAWVGGAAADLRVALRQASRNPGFAAVTVGVLALGVGVNVATMSVAEAVLLEPLPYPGGERLALVTSGHTGSTTGGFGVSWLTMRDVASRAGTIESAALYMDWQDVTHTRGDSAFRLAAAFVDEHYFTQLGLAAGRGRLFGMDENGPGSAEAVAVLGHGAWRSIFGADPEIVGSTVVLNGRAFEVVGVTTDDRGDLRYRWGESTVDVYLPLFAAEDLTRFDLDVDPGLRVLNAVIRVRADRSLTDAHAELDAISTELARERPDVNEGWVLHAQPLDEAFFDAFRAPARALVAGSVLVLLLVIVNLAALMAVRAVGRQREVAVRSALGAGRARLLRQVLIETLLLSIVAGALGVILAAWAIGATTGGGAIELPAFSEIRMSAGVLLAAAGLTVGASLCFGLASAASLLGVAAGDSLHGSASPASGPGGARWRNALVVVEVTLAFVLLVGAGLLASSFYALRGTGYGFDTDDLLLARIDLRGEDYGADELIEVAERLAAGGRAIPGARDAFIWSPNRLGHGNQVEIVTREGRWSDYPQERLEASQHAVHPGTLARLGIPVLAGRDVSVDDIAESTRVALVSETLANALWPAESPLGRRFETIDAGEQLVVEVIGVVADSRHRTRLIDPFGPQRDVFYAFAQTPWRTQTLAIRLSPRADADAVAAAIRDLVRRLNPALPVYEVTTMEQNMRREEVRSRLTATLVAFYAALAVVIAGLGLYGVLSHAVRSRTREIGVRMALGAEAGAIRSGVLRQGLVPVIGGCLVGAGLAIAGGRAMAGMLYGVSAFDPTTYTIVPMVLTAVAAVALYLPARRASRTDPTLALRSE